MEATSRSPKNQVLMPIRKQPFRVTNKIALSFNEEIRVIPHEDILFLEGEGNYTRIYYNEESCHSCNTLKHFVGRLPNYFVRVHRKYLVNLHYVEKILKRDGFTILIQDHHIPIARRSQSEFLKYFEY